MKLIFRYFSRVLSNPLVLSCLGLLLSIGSPCIALCKGISSLEPGFSYGVFYGLGFSLFVSNFYRIFPLFRSN